MDARKPLPPVFWEVLAASLLILARVWIYGPRFAVQDWFTILCAYWIYTALAAKTRAWPVVTGILMSGLLVFYAWQQLPLTLAALGWGP